MEHIDSYDEWKLAGPEYVEEERYCYFCGVTDRVEYIEEYYDERDNKIYPACEECIDYEENVNG